MYQILLNIFYIRLVHSCGANTKIQITKSKVSTPNNFRSRISYAEGVGDAADSNDPINNGLFIFESILKTSALKAVGVFTENLIVQETYFH